MKKNIILICSILIAYSISLFSGLNWDDRTSLKKNIYLTNIKNISKVFSKQYFIISKEASYRPVVTITSFLDVFIFGQRTIGHHLTNILLHIINVFFIFYFLKVTIKEKEISYLAVFIFSVFPANAEAIIFASFREELLFTLFIIAGLLCFFNNRYILSSIFFLLSLFSKESAIVYPVLIAFFIFFRKYYSGNIDNNYISLNLPGKIYIFLTFLTPLIFYFIVRFYSIKLPSDNIEIASPDIIKSAAVFFEAIKKTMYPAQFCLDCPVKILKYKLIVFPVLLLLIYFVHNSKKPVLLLGSFIYVVGLLPFSGLVKLQNLFAERYMYFSNIGFSLILAYFIQKIKFKKIILTVLTVVFVGMTVYKNLLNYDEQTLYSESLKINPDSYRLNIDLGTVYFEKGNMIKAEIYYKKAYELKPFRPEGKDGLLNIKKYLSGK